MQFHSITGDIDVKQVNNGVAAGTSDTQVFTEVNTAGQFEAILFLLNLGAVTATAVGTLRARGSTTAGGEGSAATVNCYLDPETATTASPSGLVAQATCGTGDGNTVMLLDLFRPYQYTKAELVRATANIAILAVTAILYNSRSQPFSPTDVANNGTLVTGGGQFQTGQYNVANPTLSAT